MQNWFSKLYFWKVLWCCLLLIFLFRVVARCYLTSLITSNVFGSCIFGDERGVEDMAEPIGIYMIFSIDGYLYVYIHVHVYVLYCLRLGLINRRNCNMFLSLVCWDWSVHTWMIKERLWDKHSNIPYMIK